MNNTVLRVRFLAEMGGKQQDFVIQDEFRLLENSSIKMPIIKEDMKKMGITQVDYIVIDVYTKLQE